MYILNRSPGRTVTPKTSAPFIVPLRLLFSLTLLALLAACSNPFAPGSSSNPPSATPSASSASASAPSYTCGAHSSTPVTLTMSYSTEKQEWITDVVRDFNSRHISACDGPIIVQALGTGSGQSMQDILSGTSRPDIWSPAGSVWLDLLNQQWQQKYGSSLIGTSAGDAPPLVKSPVVIAMWKPMAQALGWPTRPIGWADIARLSVTPNAWATLNHPEWGDFKFGHTHPDYSNSGLDAVIAENYAAVNKQQGLTLADVNGAVTQDFVANVESSIIHYGESTGTFATEMFQKGPGYLSAAVMYENLVVEANLGRLSSTLAYPVVAIYPKEGTFYSDHPFAILKASWVTPAKQAAALAFRDFLLAPARQQKALQYGFRPANLNVPINTPVDSAHGVDPAPLQTQLQTPSVDIVNAILSSWNQQRRKVDVMLIIDHSGSMGESIGGITKLAGAKQGLTEFVGLLGDLDNLGLTQFGNAAQVLSPVSPLGPKRQDMQNLINGIALAGNTRLYDTIAEQFHALQALPSKHIKAVVVLTDGIDNVSGRTLAQLTQEITPTGNNQGESIKIYTIAYGIPDPTQLDSHALIQVAQASGGQEYPGSPQNIKQVYLDISKFF